MTRPITAEEEEHPTNDTLERIGAFGRLCKIGKHQATNWVHLRATVDALDAAGQHEAADTLIWQVWHRVNSRARYQEFYNLGTAAERAAESRAASAEAEVERLRKAIQDFLDGNYQHPRSYRPGKCPHDIWYFDECGSCNDEHFTNALKESAHD